MPECPFCGGPASFGDRVDLSEFEIDNRDITETWLHMHVKEHQVGFTIEVSTRFLVLLLAAIYDNNPID